MSKTSTPGAGAPLFTDDAPGIPASRDSLEAFVRRIADLFKDGEQRQFDDELADDDAYDLLSGLITEARELLGQPVDRPVIIDIVVKGDVL